MLEQLVAPRSPRAIDLSRQIRHERVKNGGILSPWVYSANHEHRRENRLHTDVNTEIAIVGGGVSGILTAYFILENTKLSAAVCEAGDLAGGATGNNAGHLTATFEDTFQELVSAASKLTPDKAKQEQLAGDAYRATLMGYSMYEQIIRDPRMKSYFKDFTYHQVTSYDAIPKDQMRIYLDDLLGQYSQGITFQKMLIADDQIRDISQSVGGLERYKDVYEQVSSDELRGFLQTQKNTFPAAIASPATIMNSADFCNRLANYLQDAHPNRFKLYEQAKVSRVDINPEEVALQANGHTVHAEKVVFCTNGMNSLKVHDGDNPENNSRLKQPETNIGVMAGYVVERPKGKPRAVAYKTSRNDYPFVTEVPFSVGGKDFSLIAVGGPTEDSFHFGNIPSLAASQMLPDIAKFASGTYDSGGIIDAENPPFLWAGYMSYARDGLRSIGPAPRNPKNWEKSPRNFENRECNGIGLAPAAYGAWKISRQLSGAEFPPSLFDPK